MNIDKNFLLYKYFSWIICFIGFFLLLRYNNIQNILKYSVTFIILRRIAIMDKSKRIIPDKYNIIFFILGVLGNIYKKNHIFILGVILIGIILIMGLCIAEKVSKKELLGGGDCKLIISLTLFLGIEKSFLLFIFLELILIVIVCYKKDKEYIELGYYIYIAYMCMFLFGGIFKFL